MATLKLSGEATSNLWAVDAALDAWAADMTRRGCKGSSISRFRKVVLEALAACNLEDVRSISLGPIEEYLGRKLENGWAGTTHDGVCSALRNFGAFCLKRGLLETNPLQHLEGQGAVSSVGWIAFTTPQARALIQMALDRAAKTGKDKSRAAVYYAWLAYTGLRPEEGPKVKWRDVSLSEGVLTADKWQKNGKAGQRIPLHPRLLSLLTAHVQLVRSNPMDPVFPAVPNNHTFLLDREAAGVMLPEGAHGMYGMKSFRKWFATELDRAGASKGTVSRLLRHSDTLAEARYIQPSTEAEVSAIRALPDLWPEKFAKSVDVPVARTDTDAVTVVHRMAKPHDNSPPDSSLPMGHAEAVTSEARQSSGASCFSEAPVSGQPRVEPIEIGNGQSGALGSFQGSNIDRLLLVAEANARNLARILDLLGGSDGKRG